VRAASRARDRTIPDAFTHANIGPTWGVPAAGGRRGRRAASYPRTHRGQDPHRRL